VPLDRVWVEHVANSSTTPLGALDAPPLREPLALDMFGFSALGRRLVQAVPDGFVRDIRAVTDAYANTEGHVCLRICPEVEWYRWALTGAVPSTIEAMTTGLWLE
jgi:hypothetical protein